MKDRSNQWTRWWWVKLQQSANWSPREFRAAGAVGLVFLAIFLLMGWYGFELARALRFGTQTCIIVSIFWGLLFAIINARGIAAEIFPVVIRQGDEAAAKRLGGIVILPTDGFFVRRLWWVGNGGNLNWSAEELWTQKAIYVIAMILLLIPLSFEFRVFDDLGISKRASALVLALQLPLTFYVSRRICVWLWPDYVKRADDNAVKRSCEKT